MASLEKRNDSYRIVFRFGGQKFSRSLKTNDETSATLSLARLEDNLRRLELGTLTVEPEDDIVSVLLSSGRLNKRPTATPTETIESLLDQHLANIPEGSIEASTRTMLAVHVRHLKRLLGTRTQTAKLELSDLQAYVNKRSKEPGLRGRTVGANTLDEFRRELIETRNGTAPVPPAASACTACPLGRPQKHIPGKTDTLKHGKKLPPRLNRGAGGRSTHSNCGDRFDWIPPHGLAIEQGLREA